MKLCPAWGTYVGKVLLGLSWMRHLESVGKNLGVEVINGGCVLIRYLHAVVISKQFLVLRGSCTTPYSCSGEAALP